VAGLKHEHYILVLYKFHNNFALNFTGMDKQTDMKTDS